MDFLGMEASLATGLAGFLTAFTIVLAGFFSTLLVLAVIFAISLYMPFRPNIRLFPQKKHA